MDIIKQLMNEHGAILTEKLTSKLGFNSDQANGFVKGLISRVTGLISGGGVDIGEVFGEGGISTLTSKLNVGELATEAGIDEDQAKSALDETAPSLLSSLKDSVGGPDDLLGMLGGGDKGGVLGAIGKIF